MTIQGLLNKIFKANQTQNNTVSWSGSNGLKSIQEEIVSTIKDRTFFTVPTTADLSNQGFNNAVLCYVQDNAFYRWESTGIPNGTTIFPANDGGVWKQETLGDTDGTVKSIGITAPAAFTVTNSPVTTIGVINIAANGTSSQYIKGDGTLGSFPSNAVTGTGTANYLPKWTSSSVLGNSLVYDDGTNVGIGTTSPSGKLDVNGTFRATLLGNSAYGLTISTAASGHTTLDKIGSGADLQLTSTRHLLLNPTSNLGVNVPLTYSPRTKLSVVGPNATIPTLGTVGLSQFSVLSGNPDGTYGLIFGVTGSGISYVQNSYVDGTATAFAISLQPSGGNFLIGTSTDAGYKLDVNGTAVIRGTLYVGTTYTGLTFSGADCNIFNNGGSAGNISFSLGGNKYLNIDQITGSSSGFSSGTYNTFLTNRTYAWSSGTAISNVFNISPTINNTSTYSGTFRGLYYNPTLTSLTGTTHRAIETVTGDVIFGSTSGNVGIGTSSPVCKTQISSAAGNSTSISTIASTNYALVIQNTTNVVGTYSGIGFMNPFDTQGYIAVQQESSGYGAGGNMIFAVRPQGGGTVMTERMRIANTGNVLIGTTTDAGYKLDVNGTVRLQSSLNVGTTILASSDIRSESKFNAKGGTTVVNSRFYSYGIGRPDGGFGNTVLAGVGGFFSGVGWYNGCGLSFFTAIGSDISGGANTTEKMTLQPSGSLLLGTTTEVASSMFTMSSTTQGFLPPRMTDAQILAIVSPANGLTVYSTTQNVIAFYDGTGWHKVTHTNL